MSYIELPGLHVTEKRPNGFSAYVRDDSGAGLMHECIKLGHRLAVDGKEIVETKVRETYSTERAQSEISVECKIKHKLKP